MSFWNSPFVPFRAHQGKKYKQRLGKHAERSEKKKSGYQTCTERLDKIAANTKSSRRSVLIIRKKEKDDNSNLRHVNETSVDDSK